MPHLNINSEHSNFIPRIEAETKIAISDLKSINKIIFCNSLNIWTAKPKQEENTDQTVAGLALFPRLQPAPLYMVNEQVRIQRQKSPLQKYGR